MHAEAARVGSTGWSIVALGWKLCLRLEEIVEEIEVILLNSAGREAPAGTAPLDPA